MNSDNSNTFALRENLQHSTLVSQSQTIDFSNVSEATKNRGYYHPQTAAHNNVHSHEGRRKRMAVFIWITEILMLGVGVLCLIGIYAVLATYDNSPLPKFPYSVTLNTIISLLTQILTTTVGAATGAIISQCKWNWFSPTKSGDHQLRKLSDYVTFDQAAQGPLGAVKLLLTRPSMIIGSGAAVGALLVLAIPVVGSFTQQLVKYEARSLVYANTTFNTAVGVPTVPSSAFYDAYLTGPILASKETALAWKGGFSNAVYSAEAGIDFNITSNCVTGNCTWPDYATLGVSSICVNRTSEVVKSCDKTGQVCTYAMAYGSGPTGTLSYHYGTYINATLDSDSSGTAAVLNETSSYGNEISRATYLFTEDGGTPKAITCSLYLAVHTRRTTVLNGILTDSIVSTFPNASVADAGKKIKTAEVGSSAYTNISMIPSASDGDLFSRGSPSAIDYGIFHFSWSTITWFTKQSVSTFASGGIGEISYSTDLARVLFNLDQGVSINNQTLSLSDDEGGAVGYLYKKLADSFTVVLRSDPSSTGTSAQNGTSYRTETFVATDWKWFALPSVLLSITGILLVSVMWQTSRNGVEPFKGDSLAALFTGVLPAQAVARVAAPPDSTDEMSEVADKMHVKLSRDRNGQLVFTS
ncbi:arginase family protein [Ophiostoma piceae UAMH 11346]|uniref:Arginase family protein n=1 Tax=Ophiostoma piceae (strain UAMH 11346) TaxID=1262450 RepID=S3CPQ4_OPHP1|nr:arginase family protein [Ophiostoma piceae UAMH 11346]